MIQEVVYSHQENLQQIIGVCTTFGSQNMLQIAQSNKYNQCLQFCKVGTFLSWILQQTSAIAMWLFFMVNSTYEIIIYIFLIDCLSHETSHSYSTVLSEFLHNRLSLSYRKANEKNVLIQVFSVQLHFYCFKTKSKIQGIYFYPS